MSKPTIKHIIAAILYAVVAVDAPAAAGISFAFQEDTLRPLNDAAIEMGSPWTVEISRQPYARYLSAGAPSVATGRRGTCQGIKIASIPLVCLGAFYVVLCPLIAKVDLII